MPDAVTLRREATGWHGDRNQTGKLVDRQFTTTDARIKLERLCPHFLTPTDI